MTLRRACFLVIALALATAAYADPISVPVSSNATTLRSTNLQDFPVATTFAAARHEVQLQQFVTAGPTIPAPEPATLALFGTGLIGVATLVRFRMRRSGSPTNRK